MTFILYYQVNFSLTTFLYHKWHMKMTSMMQVIWRFWVLFDKIVI